MIIYNPKYLEKPAIEDFKVRLEGLLELLKKSNVMDNGEIFLQNEFEPITIDYAIEVGHTESLINDVSTSGFLNIALLSCGGVLKAVDEIFLKKCSNAFVTMVVGGHHAGPSSHWGFCYLNDVACAVHRIRSIYKKQKILYLDQDFHHGDGTEKFFRYDPDFFYIHAHGQRPGEKSGATVDKKYNHIDICMPRGIAGHDYCKIIEETLDFALNQQKFEPDIIINYAGYDAHVLDAFNNRTIRLSYADFINLSNILVRLSERFCENRLLCIGGGGYSNKSIDFPAVCTFNTIMVLAKEWDHLINENLNQEESDPFSRIKVNTILKSLLKARYLIN